MEVRGVNEEMAVEISRIIDSIKKIEKEPATNVEKVKTYRDIAKIFEELERQRQRILQGLDEDIREELLKSEQGPEVFEIPENLSVNDVSELLNVSPQMVRRYCTEGKIEAHQTLEGSGKWKIPTVQFMNHPNWDNFIHDKKNMNKNNMRTADIMLKMLARED